MVKFTDISKSVDDNYVVSTPDTHVFFFFNRSGRINIDLRCSGARAYIFGLFVGQNQDSFKLETLQHHSSPDTFSELLIKGVFMDQAKFSYRGLIRIEKAAQKSHAYQKNQNLLMSDKGFVESKPDLEILANDVFCTHASTTGRLDPESVFYLNGRGLPQKVVEDILITGFLREVFERINSLGSFPQLQEYKELAKAYSGQGCPICRNRHE